MEEKPVLEPQEGIYDMFLENNIDIDRLRRADEASKLKEREDEKLEFELAEKDYEEKLDIFNKMRSKYE